MNNIGSLNQVTFKSAYTHDYPLIADLLTSNSLPIDDILDSKIEFIIAFDYQFKIIGCIGIEHKERDGLIRSFAVEDKYKSQGIGTHLLQLIIEHSSSHGIIRLHLLTTTACDYFLTKGFIIDKRSSAPEQIKNTREFLGICPTSAVYMRKDL